MAAKFSNFGSILTGGTAVATIAPTSAVFVQTTGVLQVKGKGTDMINFGTVEAGVTIEIGVTQVGTLTTAHIVPLR